MDETITRIISELESLGVSWCLIGAHAVGEYTEPRATLDVDLLVDDRRMATILYESIDPDALDRERVAELAGKVYPGAEPGPLAELLRKVDAGEPITV